jgi:hypothetical protein
LTEHLSGRGPLRRLYHIKTSKRRKRFGGERGWASSNGISGDRWLANMRALLCGNLGVQGISSILELLSIKGIRHGAGRFDLQTIVVMRLVIVDK